MERRRGSLIALAALAATACLAPTRTGVGLPLSPASARAESPDDQGLFGGRKLRGATYAARAEASDQAPEALAEAGSRIQAEEPAHECALAALAACLAGAISPAASSGNEP